MCLTKKLSEKAIIIFLSFVSVNENYGFTHVVSLGSCLIGLKFLNRKNSIQNLGILGFIFPTVNSVCSVWKRRHYQVIGA